MYRSQRTGLRVRLASLVGRVHHTIESAEVDVEPVVEGRDFVTVHVEPGSGRVALDTLLAPPAESDGHGRHAAAGTARYALDEARADGVMPDLDATASTAAGYLTPWGRRTLASSVLAELTRQHPDATTGGYDAAGDVRITVTAPPDQLVGTVRPISDRLDEPRTEAWIGDQYIATGLHRGIRVSVAGTVEAAAVTS